MNFDDAMLAHMRWKLRLTDFVAGKSPEKLDPKVVCRDDQCDLGTWIHQHHVKSADADFAELRREHAAFHLHAGSIVQAVAERRPEQAQQILDGPYTKASTNVILLIKRVREKAA